MNNSDNVLAPGYAACRGGEVSHFTPVIGSIVLLTQITITIALLCQESGRQKAGNGWESRKGSGEACGGERWRKAVCVTRTGEGKEGDGQTGICSSAAAN